MQSLPHRLARVVKPLRHNGGHARQRFFRPGVLADGKMTLHTNVIVAIINGAIRPLTMPVSTPRKSRAR